MYSKNIAALLVSFVALPPVSAVAQSHFQPINYGETLAAFLTTSDDSLSDGAFYKAFLFVGQADDTVTISMMSIDFDAMILLADSTGELLQDGSDNNSGGNCNAHLTTAIPAAGNYLILATSDYPERIGEFQVSLARGVRPPRSADECRGFFESTGTLSLGDTVRGSLGPPGDAKLGSTYYQVWELHAPTGQTVTVDLLSDEFDARLTLYRGFRTPVDANDDGAGKCDARIIFTGGSHPYRLLMTTGQENQTGNYLLTMVDGALPVVETSECTP